MINFTISHISLLDFSKIRWCGFMGIFLNFTSFKLCWCGMTDFNISSVLTYDGILWFLYSVRYNFWWHGMISVFGTVLFVMIADDQFYYPILTFFHVLEEHISLLDVQNTMMHIDTFMYSNSFKLCWCGRIDFNISSFLTYDFHSMISIFRALQLMMIRNNMNIPGT